MANYSSAGGGRRPTSYRQNSAQAGRKSSAKRRRARQRRVRRNRLCLALVVLAVIILIIVLAVSCSNNKKQHEEQPTDTPEQETRVLPTGSVSMQGPMIICEDTIHIPKDSKALYKSYATITDDDDPNPVIEIDSSNVDLSTEGTYKVIYKATDKNGNQSVKEVTIIVDPPEGHVDVDDDTINAAADNILNNIIDEDMSDLDKVFAVFFHVRDGYSYVKDDEYLDYRQEAYKFIMNRQDNCYANVCLTRLLLERLGFESIMIEGEQPGLGEHHYWNMVSIDGGDTWYHYDAAWWNFKDEEYPMCMMTDAFFETICDRHIELELEYDHSKYPETPEEDLWTPEERGYTSEYE